MNTAVDVETVARWFLSQEAMSEARMQRLCYYAQPHSGDYSARRGVSPADACTREISISVLEEYAVLIGRW